MQHFIDCMKVQHLFYRIQNKQMFFLNECFAISVTDIYSTSNLNAAAPPS